MRDGLGLEELRSVYAHIAKRYDFQHALITARADQRGRKLPVNDVQEVIDSGLAHADLEADRREQQVLMVQGSPTFILNDGRQKLYGNVDYGVIEANIKELLRSPAAGAASWC